MKTVQHLVLPVIVTLSLLCVLLGLVVPAQIAHASTGIWTLTGSMTTARAHQKATLLQSGQVLVVGGQDNSGNAIASAELYDPNTGTWTATGSMSTARYLHTATLLSTGKVLVTGGVDSNGNALASAELYDPATGTWTATGSISVARFRHTATLLSTGKVLIAGGLDSNGNALASAELYDPATGTWTTTGSMTTVREDQTATLLSTGKVLVAGGNDISGTLQASAELYDPGTGTWTATGSMTTVRANQTATLLATGKVLIAGGFDSSFTPQASAELYDPGTGIWTATGSMTTVRASQAASLLQSGQVLVAGGQDSGGVLASAEFYDPSTGSWTATASMSAARNYLTATLLQSGQVLVAGGINSSALLASAELFSLVTDTDLALTNVPANMTTPATSPQGASVTYTTPTATDESGDSPGPSVSCDHASGSTFPISTTKVTCTATDSDDSNSPVSQSFNVTVTPVLTASGTSVSATEGKSFSGGVVVATGADYGAGTLSASIDWGDGQTSTGSVSLATDGSYSVKGSHVYDEEGSFALTVTVSASGGPTSIASSSASVTDAALTANTPTVTIKKLAVTIGTVFFDADPNGTASDYSVTINWGDGSSSAGTISANSTSFTATGSHTYRKHTTFTVTVKVTDAGGSSVTKTLSVKV